MDNSPLMLTHPEERVEVRARCATVISAPPPLDLPRLDGIHVLVVDDDRDARRLMKRFLEVRGARVTTAAGADEALQALTEQLPHVILSDIGMPVQDGYEFMHRVRSLPGEGSEVPAAAVTAFAHTDDRTRALLSGFQMHLAKPVDPAELLAAVASLAGRDRAH